MAEPRVYPLPAKCRQSWALGSQVTYPPLELAHPHQTEHRKAPKPMRAVAFGRQSGNISCIPITVLLGLLWVTCYAFSLQEVQVDSRERQSLLAPGCILARGSRITPFHGALYEACLKGLLLAQYPCLLLLLTAFQLRFGESAPPHPFETIFPLPAPIQAPFESVKPPHSLS